MCSFFFSFIFFHVLLLCTVNHSYIHFAVIIIIIMFSCDNKNVIFCLLFGMVPRFGVIWYHTEVWCYLVPYRGLVLYYILFTIWYGTEVWCYLVWYRGLVLDYIFLNASFLLTVNLIQSIRKWISSPNIPQVGQSLSSLCIGSLYLLPLSPMIWWFDNIIYTMAFR